MEDVEGAITFEVIGFSQGSSMGDGLGVWMDDEGSTVPKDGQY